MLTYNMDVLEESTWLRATPGGGVLAQPFYATESGHFYGQPGFATDRTNKESYLLFFTIKGKGLVTQNHQEVELPEGTALLLNCRIAQSYRTDPDTGIWEHDWVHLDGAGLASFADTLLPQGRLTPVRIGASEMLPLFDALFHQWEQNTALAQLEISLLLHQMLTALSRHLLANDESRSNRTMMEQTAAYIRTHYSEPITLDTLLARVPISKSWFLRLFRQYIGTTPYSFLLSTRITHAKELLVLTDYSVSEIAHQTGFEDESNFSTRFSSMTGQSPQQYRKSALRPSQG